MNYQVAIEKLTSSGMFYIDLGLDRIKSVLEKFIKKLFLRDFTFMTLCFGALIELQSGKLMTGTGFVLNRENHSMSSSEAINIKYSAFMQLNLILIQHILLLFKVLFMQGNG